MMNHFVKCAIASAVLSAPVLTNQAAAQTLLPTNARPGECYAKVLVPASYRSISEQVMIQSGGVKYTKTPAAYRTIEKQILVADESYSLIVTPATYRNVEETVLIQPEQTIKTVVPATFRTESKQVMISPARSEWKVGRGAYEKLDSATGDIMCLVEVPAKYKTVHQTVVDKPAQTLEKTIPAKYTTISKRVMDTPPSTARKVIPAKYKTVSVRELVTPESFDAVKSEPQFATIEKRQLINTESVQWRQILCQTNVNEKVVYNIQRALVREGYNLGTQPNGNFGPATKAAIRKFQLANGLPTGGLTMAAVKKLGL